MEQSNNKQPRKVPEQDKKAHQRHLITPEAPTHLGDDHLSLKQLHIFCTLLPSLLRPLSTSSNPHFLIHFLSLSFSVSLPLPLFFFFFRILFLTLSFFTFTLFFYFFFFSSSSAPLASPSPSPTLFPFPSPSPSFPLPRNKGASSCRRSGKCRLFHQKSDQEKIHPPGAFQTYIVLGLPETSEPMPQADEDFTFLILSITGLNESTFILLFSWGLTDDKDSIQSDKNKKAKSRSNKITSNK